MTTVDQTSVTEPPADTSAAPTQPDPRRASWLGDLLRRLHFYAGLLVGPFVLVAAATGLLYAVSPTLEEVLYADELHTTSTGTPVPLAEQVVAARAHLGTLDMPVAVRPAPGPGDTTRVMFADDSLAESETRGIFVDPVTAEVVGDLTVYGTSGALPMRTWISQLHRHLHLGEPGRFYSELAASWLWIVAAAGGALWVARVRTARRKKDLVVPNLTARGYRRAFSLHASLGVWVLLGALFLSATGMTWSQLAGANVSELRSAAGWETPALSTALDGEDDAAGGGHDHHHHGGGDGATTAYVIPASFDAAYDTARTVNIDAAPAEIQVPADAESAWVVREIKRSYPTAGDSVAIDGDTLEVVDRTDFDEFPLMAQLSSWGISLHMGVMFGWVNQLALALLALGIGAMVVLGYVMWWKRRPTREPRGLGGPAPERGVLRGAPWWGVVAVAAVGVGVGLFVPLVGYTLVAFLVVDVVAGLLRSRRTV